MENYNVLFDAQAAVEAVLPDVVARHRGKGILTWKLIHQIEEEVLSEVRAGGRFSPRLLQMICAPAALSYPKDEGPVSFEGHDFVPIVFSAIDRAWRLIPTCGGTPNADRS
ncbi:hypothetical protein WQE_19804 [Paraburkholderia hospita]|uniref:DUF2471 domain-containing protein n=1 Tax=Paraburkholderia hospita TaxID=169430 RepID=A0ABN0FKN8_9BURK|nr:DUF2471 family protein [Paraburkholderia hospita]EIM99277.1 hypothetical protein WQE_19804 [Paraburkholderia hospita]OUL87680.1 DUF2471 domain-containing protein [Paraburkholderia hospita]